VGRVVVVLPPTYVARPPEWLGRLVGERLTLVPGGAQRADSVQAGLAALEPTAPVVLVHDAARPFVTRETIDGVIARARTGVGAVAAAPMSDTVKQVHEGTRVARTVPRDGLWRAQTPQGFPLAMLREAYGRLTDDLAPPTDDAEVCQRCGFPVDVVPDSAWNLKITTADDFRLAEALARESR
jgi:2-C-methyl-D-erythritol 4-phosphate cytidylyltransferase